MFNHVKQLCIYTHVQHCKTVFVWAGLATMTTLFGLRNKATWMGLEKEKKYLILFGKRLLTFAFTETQTPSPG